MMDKAVVRSMSGNMTKELGSMAEKAGKYGWIVLATPFLIYMTDKLYDLSNDVMDKGYGMSLTANAEGVKFDLKKPETVTQ